LPESQNYESHLYLFFGPPLVSQELSFSAAGFFGDGLFGARPASLPRNSAFINVFGLARSSRLEKRGFYQLFGEPGLALRKTQLFGSALSLSERTHLLPMFWTGAASFPEKLSFYRLFGAPDLCLPKNSAFYQCFGPAHLVPEKLSFYQCFGQARSRSPKTQLISSLERPDLLSPKNSAFINVLDRPRLALQELSFYQLFETARPSLSQKTQLLSAF
jgi:hypothetical protein